VPPPRPADAAESWRDGFDRWWDGLWGFGLAQPLLFTFVETHHHAPYLDADSTRIAEELDVRAIGFVAAGQAAGAFRPGDPAMLVSLAMGAFVGLLRAGPLDPSVRTESADAAWQLLRAPDTT